jgi:hypothetical protein
MMETDDGPGQGCVAIGQLSLEANIVVAGSSMSAIDVDRARGAGRLDMAESADQSAYLEVGGVVVAAGLLRKKRGSSVFVVTRMMADGQEVRL